MTYHIHRKLSQEFGYTIIESDNNGTCNYIGGFYKDISADRFGYEYGFYFHEPILVKTTVSLQYPTLSNSNIEELLNTFSNLTVPWLFPEINNQRFLEAFYLHKL